MCNPRRVHVVATRTVVEAWQSEVRRTASVSDTVNSEVRIARPFGSTLGERTRAVFEQALAADPQWQEADGVHRLPLEDAEVTYRPSTGELTITARLRSTITAEAEASEDLHGVEQDVATGSGFGSPYGEADRAARSDAERNAAAMRDRLRQRADTAAREAAEAAADRVQARAERAARSDLDARRAEEQQALDEQNRNRLNELGQAGMNAVNAVLGQAYREALLVYAREHGATDIRVDDSEDGVLDMEFQVEA